MSVTFKKLCDDGVLTPIHQAFGELLPRLSNDLHPHVQLAGALASEQLSRGHVCFELPAVKSLAFQKGDSAERVVRYADWPATISWTRELERSSLVCSRSTADEGVTGDLPLVFETHYQRVYLARYWFVQQQLAGWIASRLKSDPLPVDLNQLDADLEILFSAGNEAADRDQRLAVRNAVNRRFAVITGGPGTGKTTTVARLLAARLMQLATSPNKATKASGSNSTAGPSTPQSPLRIVLMAPTGKAAQRLNESLKTAVSKLPTSVPATVKEQIKQVTAGTIHRQLQWTPLPPERGGPFRKGPQQPLDADIVLVDEASMVDIELMWHLFAALRDETQVILMGDRDQLASVEAGGVLSDLCDASLMSESMNASRKPATTSSLKSTAVVGLATNLLATSVSWLRVSHRFSSDSPLGQLAASIRQGHADDVLHRLSSANDPQLVWISHESSETALKQVVEQAAERYRVYLDQLRQLTSTATTNDALRTVLKSLASVRVLCAHRDGNSGERAMNQRIAQQLAHLGLLRPRPGAYVGQAVIVTENDHRQELYNGDVGVVVPSPRGHGLAIAFEDPRDERSVRLVPTALAPAFQDCWAMTIHKSQGSEFGAVFVVLPEFTSPVLSRELLYTAVTRVKQESKSPTADRSGYLAIVGRREVTRATVLHEIRRTSGLRDAILARCPSAPKPKTVATKAKKKVFQQRTFAFD